MQTRWQPQCVLGYMFEHTIQHTTPEESLSITAIYCMTDVILDAATVVHAQQQRRLSSYKL
jgi:hypothetical protein